MKNIFKAIVCFLMPLTISSCSGLNFGGNENTPDNYEVVSRQEALNFASTLQNKNYTKVNTVDVRYKYKTKLTADSNEYISDTYAYQAHLIMENWETSDYTAQNDQYLCYTALTCFYTFQRTYDYTINNNFGKTNNYLARFSIDRNKEKIKVELVEKDSNITRKTRVEFDNTCYMRSSLTTQEQLSNGQTISSSALFNYSYDEKSGGWLNDDYGFTLHGGPSELQAEVETPLTFYYYSNSHGEGVLNFYEFKNNNVINDIWTEGCDYWLQDSETMMVRAYQGVSEAKIFFNLFNGAQYEFYFPVVSGLLDAEWINVTDAINQGRTNNTYIQRTGVFVAGFLENEVQPTSSGGMMVNDDYGATYYLTFSTLAPIQQRLRYKEPFYEWDVYNDFYSFEIGTQYGCTFYGDSLTIGDFLEIIYVLDGDKIAFAAIVGVSLNDRLANKYVYPQNLANAFEHAATNGEKKYIYHDIWVDIKSYYGSYKDPSNYGDFIVTDNNGETTYNIYGSVIFADPQSHFIYDSNTGDFSFYNPRNFLALDYVLGYDYLGQPILPKNLMPGDRLFIDFIISSNRLYAIIKECQLTSREPKTEPEALTLSLSDIFARNDANGTRKYHTFGYITEFTTYGMYIKEDLNDELSYFVYSASMDQSFLTYNSTTGLYEIGTRVQFKNNHGELKLADKVYMDVTRNDYNGTWELVGYVTGWESAPACQTITSPDTGNIYLSAGGTYQLNFTCEPASAALRAEYYSSDINYVTVSSTGLVKVINGADGLGITVWVKIDGCEYNWNVIITGDTCDYVNFVNNSVIQMDIGTTFQLTIDCQPVSASSRVVYSSDNPAVAVVDKNGLVTALSQGVALIEATIDGVSAVCKIYVGIEPCQYINSTSPNPITLKVGENYKIEFSCTPSSAASRAMFGSNNDAIATIDSNGVITGVQTGSAAIVIVVDEIYVTFEVNVIV